MAILASGSAGLFQRVVLKENSFRVLYFTPQKTHMSPESQWISYIEIGDAFVDFSRGVYGVENSTKDEDEPLA